MTLKEFFSNLLERIGPMEALEILLKEHGLIWRFLDILRLGVEKLEEGERPPVEFFENAIEFARKFSDKYHHFKEEYLLFNLLARKENGRMDAQIDSLRYLHERGRTLIQGLAQSLEGYSQGREAQTIAILENMAAYISLLRQHIHKEDHIFFLMAAKEISEKEDAELVEAFIREEEKMGGNALANSSKLLEEMDELLS